MGLNAFACEYITTSEKLKGLKRRLDGKSIEKHILHSFGPDGEGFSIMPQNESATA